MSSRAFAIAWLSATPCVGSAEADGARAGTEAGAAVGTAEQRLAAHLRTSDDIGTLLAHPAQSAVFTSRPQTSGSRLELWQLRGSQLQIVSDTWISGDVAALAQHGDGLWVATRDRLTRLPIVDLRSPCPFEVKLPMPGTQAMVTQTMPVPLEV